MKVYVLASTNGHENEGADHNAIGVFMSYRGATESIMRKGFVPVPLQDRKTNAWHLFFEEERIVEGLDEPRGAWISEFVLGE